MSHFTWLASLDMYLNSHNFRKPSRLILKCSYEFLKCSKEFECPACGKHRDATSWSFPTEAGDLLGQSWALMHILTWSSPIVHELFNGSSEYNEQPYSGEKCLPCPGIEPKTFCFPCSCSTIELRGWDNSTRNNYETCIAFGVTHIPFEGSQLLLLYIQFLEALGLKVGCLLDNSFSKSIKTSVFCKIARDKACHTKTQSASFNVGHITPDCYNNKAFKIWPN